MKTINICFSPFSSYAGSLSLQRLVGCIVLMAYWNTKQLTPQGIQVTQHYTYNTDPGNTQPSQICAPCIWHRHILALKAESHWFTPTPLRSSDMTLTNVWSNLLHTCVPPQHQHHTDTHAWLCHHLVGGLLFKDWPLSYEITSFSLDLSKWSWAKQQSAVW